MAGTSRSPAAGRVQMLQAPVQMSGGQPTLVASININTPSTYDSAHGHSYGRHGAHTTEAQQRRRLTHGIAPNNDRAPVPASAPGASKFDSDDLHVTAIKKAVDKLVDKNKNRSDPATYKGLNGKIGMSGAGTIYKRDNTSETASDVIVDLRKVDDNGTFNINTAFPTK